ncbi:MAG: imidazoleglycerol-phosphate dehydratase HisB [Deltaproteobacteria bacterium]|nr:imidazoleglycerol-phosphate dehydratase HisB [Deltaproteobacteria bacterium]
MARSAEVKRRTKETDIQITLNLDGKGLSSIDTSIPFLDHMFELMAGHGFMDLTVKAKGDTEIDYHHTVEDLGICLGQAVSKALGEKKAIRRYGKASVPMDEALAQVVIDISNRPYLSYKVPLKTSLTGKFDVGILSEFFRALVNHAGLTMHIELVSGDDPHHSAEAIFKAFARALDDASQREERLEGVPSTKGLL